MTRKGCRIGTDAKKIKRMFCFVQNPLLSQTLYLGIEDDGTVQGLRLTRGQRDSIRLAVDKAVSSFRYLISGCFIPSTSYGVTQALQSRVVFRNFFLSKGNILEPVRLEAFQGGGMTLG